MLRIPASAESCGVGQDLSHLGECLLKHGGSVGPSGPLRSMGGKTEWEGRRTGGVKHQVTVYIPPRRHVAQTEEHQLPSVAKSTRQGHVYYTIVLMQRLLTLRY